MFSLTLFDDCSFLFFTRISIMTALAKFKPVQSPRWVLVISALPNFNMKHYKSVKSLSNFQNGEPNSYNHLGAFNVTYTYFARVWEIFIVVVSELQHVPHPVLQRLFISPHVLYRCSVFVFSNTGKKKQMWFLKKRRPWVLLNISIVANSVGLPVAVNNPVPASQAGFQQFRAIQHFCVEGSNKRSDAWALQ